MRDRRFSSPSVASVPFRPDKIRTEVGFGGIEFGRNMPDGGLDEHVVRFLGGDVMNTTPALVNRRGVTTRPTLSLPRNTTLGPWFRISRSMWSASSVWGELAESFRFERRRWCERPYLFAKTRDDFDVVLFVLTDPSLLPCVSFSLRDDDYGRDPFVERGCRTRRP